VAPPRVSARRARAAAVAARIAKASASSRRAVVALVAALPAVVVAVAAVDGPVAVPAVDARGPQARVVRVDVPPVAGARSGRRGMRNRRLPSRRIRRCPTRRPRI
jgi:hypothetical protein